MATTEFLSPNDFAKQIEKSPKCAYLFFGDEDYLKSHSLKLARKNLVPDESLAPFNNFRLDGLDLTPDSLLNAITTLPMMSDRKLIEVTGLNFKELKNAEIDDYISVISTLEEYDYNTLIIVASSISFDAGTKTRPSQLLKKLSEVMTPVQFTRSSPVMLARWAAKHFLANGVRADDAVCTTLIDYCGTDMFKLANETDKTSWYVLSSGRNEVSPSDIGAVAIADTSYGAFEFTDALAARDGKAALKVIAEQARLKIDPIVAMGEIISVFSNMLTAKMLAADGLPPAKIASRIGMANREFLVKRWLQSPVSIERLNEILEECAKTDIELKFSLSGEGFLPVERLVCSLSK